jgi:hypothetical protein
VLRLAGWKSDANEIDGKKKALEQMERALPLYLKKAFPECEVTVSPATVMHSGAGGEQSA